MKKSKLFKKFFSCFGVALTCFSCGAFFSACTETPVDHTIQVETSDIRKGTVSGAGVYKTGYSVNLKAITNNPESSNFIGWLKNNVIVSYEANYSFEANIDTEGKYTALFSTNTLEFFKLDKITYSINNLTFENEATDTLKVSNIEILWNTVPALYENFATAGEQEVFNTGILETSAFEFDDFILSKNQTYYFQIKINFESTTSAGTEKLPLEQNFQIDFTKINQSDSSVKYSITTETEDDITKVIVDFNGLENFEKWNDTEEPENSVSQNLKFEFVYPISQPAETPNS